MEGNRDAHARLDMPYRRPHFLNYAADLMPQYSGLEQFGAEPFPIAIP
jgi:hypothetical protein